jgi:hypothetical protein
MLISVLYLKEINMYNLVSTELGEEYTKVRTDLYNGIDNNLEYDDTS